MTPVKFYFPRCKNLMILKLALFPSWIILWNGFYYGSPSLIRRPRSSVTVHHFPQGHSFFLLVWGKGRSLNSRVVNLVNSVWYKATAWSNPCHRLLDERPTDLVTFVFFQNFQILTFNKNKSIIDTLVRLEKKFRNKLAQVPIKMAT